MASHRKSAVDSPALKRKLLLHYGAAALVTLVSPDAYVARSAQLASGCIVQRGVKILPGVRLGLACKVNVNATVASDEGLAHLFNRALLDPDALTPEQRARTGLILRMYHNQSNKLFYLYGAGILSEQEWSDYAAQWGQILTTPGGTAYLRGNTDNPDLVEAVRPYVGRSIFSFDIPIGR